MTSVSDVVAMFRRDSRYVMPDKPAFTGTWNLYLGRPRTGKTHDAARHWVRAGLDNGLPLIGQDVTGNLASRLDGFKIQAREDIELGKNVDYNRYVIRHLDNAELFNGEHTGDMLELLSDLVKRSRRASWVPQWQAVCLLDEGAIIRKYNEQFMDVTAPLFGNAGILGFLTAHRDVGASPALRACERCIVLYPGSEQHVTHLGFEIPEDMKLSDRNQLVYRYNDQFRVWDRKGTIPLELTTPAALSKPVKERV